MNIKRIELTLIMMNSHNIIRMNYLKIIYSSYRLFLYCFINPSFSFLLKIFHSLYYYYLYLYLYLLFYPYYKFLYFSFYNYQPSQCSSFNLNFLLIFLLILQIYQISKVLYFQICKFELEMSHLIIILINYFTLIYLKFIFFL